MSLLEKTIIPLIGINVTKEDFTEKTGFIDSYTSDPDHPNCYKELLLAFDDRVRTEESKNLAVRLTCSPNTKKSYVKRINNIPYLIYVVYVPHTLHKHYDSTICLSLEERVKLINFWGVQDKDVSKLVCHTSVFDNTVHKVPLEDYEPDDNPGIVVKK